MLSIILTFLVFGLDDAAAAIIIGGIIGVVSDIFSTVSNNASNRQLYEDNKAWQESMMDKQNAYNSPAEQMRRYKEAGINPAGIGMASGGLAASNISASPNNVSPIPNQNVLSSSSLSNLMTAFKSGQEGLSEKSQRQVQLEKTQAEIEQLKQNTELIGLNAQAQQIVNTYAAAREQYALAEADGRIKKLFSDMNLNYRQMSYLNSQIKEIEFRISEVLPAEVNKVIADTGVSYLEQDKIVAIIKDTLSSAELKTAQTETEGFKQENLQASTEYTEAQTNRYDEVTNAYLEKTGAEVSKLAADTGYTEEQTYWYAFDVTSRNASKFMGIKVAPSTFNNERRTTRRVLRKYSKNSKNN